MTSNENLRGVCARFVGRYCPDFRGKDQLVRQLYHPDRILGRDFEVDYFGKTYTGNTSEFVDWCVYVYGGAERAAITRIRKLLETSRRNWSLVDAGANTGTYSLALSDHVSTGLAFEPVSRTRDRLHANLARNSIRHIHVEACALGATEATAEIFYPSRHANRGIASLLRKRNLNNDLAECVSVKPLDRFLAALPPGNTIFLKIDVEGMEAELLAGTQSLRGFDVFMMIETERDDVLGVLRSWGFDGISIENHYSRLRTFPLAAGHGNHLLWNFEINRAALLRDR